jgi:hypothetical protein
MPQCEILGLPDVYGYHFYIHTDFRVFENRVSDFFIRERGFAVHDPPFDQFYVIIANTSERQLEPEHFRFHSITSSAIGHSPSCHRYVQIPHPLE